MPGHYWQELSESARSSEPYTLKACEKQLTDGYVICGAVSSALSLLQTSIGADRGNASCVTHSRMVEGTTSVECQVCRRAVPMLSVFCTTCALDWWLKIGARKVGASITMRFTINSRPAHMWAAIFGL